MMQQNSKKKIGFKIPISIFFSFMLIFCIQSAVFAASPAKPGTVLTVNTALNAEPANSEDENNPQADVTEVEPEPVWVWHPISVVNEPLNGFNAIRKTYALPPDVNPGVISTTNFEMFGQQFSFAYVIQQSTSDESFIEMRETVTIETRSNALSDILPNLEQEIWYEKDGFAGTLTLDLHSIKSEVAGTSKHTSTATRQRTYPHLSAPDNALIPRTIIDGGTTFHLSTVDWQSASVSAVDGHSVASTHTANATYTAQVTQTRNTGYTVTAEYVGTVFRTTEGKTIYSAIFYGEPIIEVWLEEPVEEPPVVTPEALKPMPEPTPEPTPEPIPQNQSKVGLSNAAIIALAVIATLIALGAVGAGAFFLAKHFLGYNVTVYSIDGPREIVKAGKIKLDLNSPEPTITLDKTIGSNTAKTDRYIIQIAQRAIPKLVNKVVRVVLRDKEALHKVPEKALGVPVYEFEVNFSDDDEPNPAAEADAEGYLFGGDE